MKTFTPSLNRLISDSMAFESHIQGDNVTVFKYEGNIIKVLTALGFGRQYFKETASGRFLPSSMYFNNITNESVFLFESNKTFTFSGSDLIPVKY